MVVELGLALDVSAYLVYLENKVYLIYVIYFINLMYLVDFIYLIHIS